MKLKNIEYFVILIALLFMVGCKSKTSETQQPKEAQISIQELKSSFQSPPEKYGINCWWWWLNGHVDTLAIKSDLEAMKSRDFQGAMVFDAGGYNQRGNGDIPAGPLFGSPDWNKLFVYALDEAEKLGLQIGFNIQSGWNLGGPMVTPQYTAKQITFTETKFTGGKKVTLQLKTPNSRRDFYKDIAVLALPVNPQQKTDQTISNLNLKLGYSELGGSAPDTRFLLTNTPRNNRRSQNQSTYVVNKNEIQNLSAKMDANGNFTWDAPEGEWSVLRIGYTCTDSQ
ncbi:MAG TPA: glycosyl hydrolase, partial [Draconibacterium sp.]|nr:glycosyl hydrolase [Draconibacterium sp.]